MTYSWSSAQETVSQNSAWLTLTSKWKLMIILRSYISATLGHNTLDYDYSIKYQSINTIGHTLSRHMDSQCKQPEDIVVAAVPMELEVSKILASIIRSLLVTSEMVHETIAWSITVKSYLFPLHTLINSMSQSTASTILPTFILFEVNGCIILCSWPVPEFPWSQLHVDFAVDSITLL